MAQQPKTLAAQSDVVSIPRTCAEPARPQTFSEGDFSSVFMSRGRFGKASLRLEPVPQGNPG